MKQRLIDILNIPSIPENSILLSHYVLSMCSKLGVSVEIDETGNILITKGKSEVYPCVVAHLDTVQPYKDINVYEENGKLHSKIGIGGDDKCGVFICLELLRLMPKLKVALFVGEESACIGSEDVDLKWFDDCGYIIGIDRYGKSDYIDHYFNSKTTSKRFNRAVRDCINAYGYKSHSGIITDVFTLLTNNVGLSCCNMSCGYYFHHTKDEFVIIDDVFNALNLVKDMIYSLGYERYEFNYDVYDWKSNQVAKEEYEDFRQQYTDYQYGYTNSDHNKIISLKCDYCERWVGEDEIHYIDDEKICDDCWLYLMGTEFESDKIITTEK